MRPSTLAETAFVLRREMMTAVTVCWVLAMIAGMSWARWGAGALTVAAMGTLVGASWATLTQGPGWLLLAAVGLGPWLLVTQRRVHREVLQGYQRQDAAQMSGLQHEAREVLSLQSSNRELETSIAHITDVYHVTKETAGALHLEELFAGSLEIAPRLLDAHGLRLIDLSREEPTVLRAARAGNGRLVAQSANHLQELEQAIIREATASGQPAWKAGDELGCPLPEGISRIAWAPLWREQKPIGVLVAENLPDNQVTTLSIVANQLSLQLSRIHLYQQVESMAVTDALTGVFVRRYFIERMTEELTRAQRHGLVCSLLMVDLDFFKQKNDTYGHLVGDVVLREVAQLLKRHLREVDLIARYGGEEFVLLLVETGIDQAVTIAERLRQLVEIHPIRAYDELLTQTISVGVAAYPQDGQTLDVLLEHSDRALYAAKHAGRNRVARSMPADRA